LFASSSRHCNRFPTIQVGTFLSISQLLVSPLALYAYLSFCTTTSYIGTLSDYWLRRRSRIINVVSAINLLVFCPFKKVTPSTWVFPLQQRIWRFWRFCIDAVIDPQLPSPCPRRNTCAYPLFASQIRRNGTYQQENDWDPTRSMFVCGRDSPLRLLFSRRLTRTFFRQPRDRSRRDSDDQRLKLHKYLFQTSRHFRPLIPCSTALRLRPQMRPQPTQRFKFGRVRGPRSRRYYTTRHHVALGIYFYLRRKRRNALSHASSASLPTVPRSYWTVHRRHTPKPEERWYCRLTGLVHLHRCPRHP